MRNLYELFSETEADRIWFWIGPLLGSKQRFLQDCKYSGIQTTGFTPGNVVSLHRDGGLRHVSVMVWIAGFSHEKFITIPKVDYETFREGRNDYLFTKCNLKPIVVPSESSKE